MGVSGRQVGLWQTHRLREESTVRWEVGCEKSQAKGRGVSGIGGHADTANK